MPQFHPLWVTSVHPRAADDASTRQPEFMARAGPGPRATVAHPRGLPMAIDTLIAFVGVYDSVDDAEADYRLVHDLHSEARPIDAWDAGGTQGGGEGKGK